MSKENGEAPPRLEPVECPHCGNPTMPNLLSDGSLVCSCPAEHVLRGADDGTPAVPPPVDDAAPPNPGS